jgi:hypothetical protein
MHMKSHQLRKRWRPPLGRLVGNRFQDVVAFDLGHLTGRLYAHAAAFLGIGVFEAGPVGPLVGPPWSAPRLAG